MSAAESARGLGDFFAVDRRTFARVCELGMNPMVAYLVLASGSDRQNRRTAWSVNAIEAYTGIARSRARAAINALQDARVLQVIRESTRPRYEIVPAHEAPGLLRPELKALEHQTVEKIKLGRTLSSRDRRFADSAVGKLWLVNLPEKNYALAPAPSAEPEWIWLPNQLVTGAAEETTPLELVRQAQDPMTLRLLVDLYYVQNLLEDGGISRQFVHQTFERAKVGERGQFVIWGFRRGTTWVTWKGPTVCHRRDDLPQAQCGDDFFRRLNQLAALGLIKWIPHLVESDLPEAEVIHAYGLGGSDSLEDRLGTAAHIAGEYMVTQGQYKHASGYSSAVSTLWLAPVLRHVANVQLVGVGRLHYRPRTALTAAWWADLNSKGERFIQRYTDLAEEAKKRRAM